MLFDNDAALINYKDKALSLYFVEDSTFALVIFFNNFYSRIGSRIDFKTDFEECVIDKKKYHRTEWVLQFNQKCIKDNLKKNYIQNIRNIYNLRFNKSKSLHP